MREIRRMRVTPASLYRNLLYVVGGSLVLYAFYSIVAFDDGGSQVHSAHRRQKHLYLTVNKDRIGDRFGVLAPKKILYYTPIFHHYPEGAMQDCRGLETRCLFVKDKSLVSSVDAVMFHSVDLVNAEFPGEIERNSSQVYIYTSMETPLNSGSTDKLKAIPANFFNWTMTFLHSSDVLWKYGSFWISNKEAEEKGYSITSYHVNRAKLKKTKKGIVGFISNCHTDMLREKVVDELSKYMEVTVGGSCAKNNETRNVCPKGQSCDNIIEQYPFFFALENSICTDYVTEKYWSRVHLASVPIVARRAVMASSNAPPKSFIALDDYKSPKEMAEHLKYLESNETAYAEYFAWRMDWTVAPWQTAGYRNGPCLLCEKLWQKEISSKSYENVYDWFEKQSQCDHGDFVRKWIS